jgi:Protein of unknown function (DUF2934)
MAHEPGAHEPTHHEHEAEGHGLEPDEHAIRERAYAIWVEEGKPDGRAVDHWLRARWELEQAPDPEAELRQLERGLEPGRKTA